MADRQSSFTREDCQNLGSEMIALGLTVQDAATLLGCSSGILHRDIRALGHIATRFPDRPEPRIRGDVYQAVSNKVTTLTLEFKASEPDTFKRTLADLLSRWLASFDRERLPVSRRDRRAAIRELVALGWSYDVIERLTSFSRKTIYDDVCAMGGMQAFPGRPSTSAQVFCATLRVYIETERTQQCVAGVDPTWYLRLLSRWLGLSEAMATLHGIEAYQRMLARPSCASEHTGHVRLYLALLLETSEDQDKLKVHQAVEIAWRVYAGQLLDNRRSWPASRKEFMRDLQDMVVADRRERIWPSWSAADTALLDEAMATLGERTQRVVRGLYRIGSRRLSLNTLKTMSGVTTNPGVYRIRDAGLRALRSHEAFRRLSVFIQPIGVLKGQARRAEDELNAAMVKIAELERTTSSLQVQLHDAGARVYVADQSNPYLARHVNTRGLSVYSANCLRVAGIEYIWQLVEKTDAEMLEIRRFGPKSLKEIKDVLMAIGLHLGMTLHGFSKPTPSPS
jgi:hypothetical protein